MAAQRQKQKNYATLAVNQEKMAADFKNQELATQNLEKQVSQLAQAQNARPQGGLSSDTE